MIKAGLQNNTADTALPPTKIQILDVNSLSNKKMPNVLINNKERTYTTAKVWWKNSAELLTNGDPAK